MSNLPITSRIKRSPLLIEYIDPENPNVTVGGVTKGPDKIVTTTKTKDFNKEWDKEKAGGLTYAEWIKKPGNKEKEDAFVKSQQETTTTTTPGETTTWEGTIKEETKGDVFQPWETRQMSRSIKKEQRDIRRAKIKEARANGTLTPEQRKQFKSEEAKAEKEEFQAMADRAKAARGSGKKGGSEDVTTGQTDKLQGKLTKEQQEKMLAEKAARDAGVITAKKEEQKKISEEGEAGWAADDEARKNKTGIYAPKDKSDSGAKMKPSAFKMYAKSPATKKLQGAQNKLPQHLQDAIKAAPGKMKAPLKKGYFKK